MLCGILMTPTPRREDVFSGERRRKSWRPKNIDQQCAKMEHAQPQRVGYENRCRRSGKRAAVYLVQRE